MKRRTSKSVDDQEGPYVRISLSIPRKLWPYFERQTKLLKHSGNRSSYVRSLIVAEMEANK